MTSYVFHTHISGFQQNMGKLQQSFADQRVNLI